MRDDMNPFAPSPSPEASHGGTTPAESPATTPETPPAVAEPVVAPAVLKFKSCRWRCDPDDGEFCTHRDVLPFAGKNDFKADSWCPECAFYKLRRTPKKRDWAAERANNY
jgi:hypothetical protein